MAEISQAMIAALRVLERGDLGRAGIGWVGKGGEFIGHATILGLKRHRLVRVTPSGAGEYPRVIINARGRQVIR